MQPNTVNPQEVEDLLSSYISSPIVQKLHDYYSDPSFLEILRVDRKENYHSNFLKWLFEDDEMCKLANKSLLILLHRRARQQNSYFPGWLKSAILSNSFNIDHVKAELEDSIQAGESKGRCDILIDILYHCNNDDPKHLHVFIENKIYSDEHKVGKSNVMQTVFYYNYYNQLFKEDNCVFVFLNLIRPWELNEISKPRCSCEKYVQINYQDILDNILKTLINDTTIGQRKIFILKEYVKALSTNYTQNKSIMAIDDSLRKLLVDFWNNNHTLIELSIEALASSDDPDMDDEQRKAINNVNKSIKTMNNQKDDTKYSFNGNNGLGKKKLVDKVLEYFIMQGTTIDKINDNWSSFVSQQNGKLADFPQEELWTHQKHQDYLDKNAEAELKKFKFENNNKEIKKLIVEADKYDCYKNQIKIEQPKKKDVDHDYPTLEIKGVEYRCFNQWSWKNIDYLIKFYRTFIKKDDAPKIILHLNE